VFHLVIAGILFFNIVFLFLLAIKNLRGEKVLVRPTQFLLGLVVLQLFLGMGTWVLKYSWPAGLFPQSRLVAGWTNTAGGIAESLVITAHVAIGSLILGVAVMAGLRFFHGARNVSSPEAKSYPLMGVTT
jgi:cytochrome c oxidase assembly protein subunit 15